MKKQISISKVISIVLCITVFSYMAYNAFAYSYSPIDTITLTEKTEFEETFEFTGFALRDEKVIAKNISGSVLPLVNDGNRVAKGDPVAVVCNNDADALSYKKLELAKKNLERYKKLSSNIGAEELSAEKLNSDILTAYENMMDGITCGIYDKIGEYSEAFEEKCATKQILVENSIDVSSQISALEAEIASLEGKNIATTPLSAPGSGYYINTADGCENILKYEDALSLSAGQISKALKSKPTPGTNSSMGKIVSSYRWYMVGIADKKYSTEFSAGKSIKVNFPDSGIKNVTMRVDSVKAEGNGLTVVLSCNIMDEVYANMRIETVQVITSSGEGYKIPSNAVRFDSNNKSGIYVLRGKIISYIYADILYAEGDSVIVDSTDSNGSGIALYDEVIIKGKDLEDGNVIR